MCKTVYVTNFFVPITKQEPNSEDPLNKEAAEVLRTNVKLFSQHVRKSMNGGQIGNVQFDRCLIK